MKIGMIQSPVTASKEANLANAEQAIARAAADGADVAVLPEMFNCPYYNAAFVANAEPADGESVARLSAAAAQNGIYLVGGSIPLLEEGHIYNASFVFDRAGRLLAVHKKVHLFDIAIDGGQVFRESATFTAGDAVTVFDTEFGKMGLCICFDFRFPELARLMALEDGHFQALAQQYVGKGDVLLFEDGLSPNSLRRLCDAVLRTCGGRCACFSEGRYAIGQPGGDLRAFTQKLNQALNGRGGGKPDFIQGSVQASQAEIEAFFQRGVNL